MLNLPRTTVPSAIYSMEKKSSTQKERVSIYKDGASQAVRTENSAELHTVRSTTTRASHDRLVTTIPQSPIPEPNQSSDQDRVREYVDSSGAKSLLENNAICCMRLLLLILIIADSAKPALMPL
ncbi:hypothetical protein PMIN04_013206, partial [Paraphaeosphaeria minitans]